MNTTRPPTPGPRPQTRAEVERLVRLLGDVYALPVGTQERDEARERLERALHETEDARKR